MTSLLLCGLALVVSFIAGRRSLVGGLVSVLAIGYAYGITRANLPETFAHLIFDAGVLGFYCSRLPELLSPLAGSKLAVLKLWVLALIAWPVALFFVPFQDPMVQLVGLRGNVLLLPVALMGARLEDGEAYRLALWMAVLNVMAFALACAEFFLGVKEFFPYRQGVTDIIYRSNDLVGYTAFRIPSSFANAHAYGGTMVATLPWLLGAWVQRHPGRGRGLLLTLAIPASILGVFMSAARTHMIIVFALLAVASFLLLRFSGRVQPAVVVLWLILLLGVGWVVSSDERLQRFKTLEDTSYLANRVKGSVSLDFWEAARGYPFGNGLGGGGTSIPYFLEDRVESAIRVESEYGRILLEQGIPGLLIWASFIVWLLSQATFDRRNPWYLGLRLAWFNCVALFASGVIGLGLLTSIPQSWLLVLSIGWIVAHHQSGIQSQAAPYRVERREPVPVRQDG